ncbi:MAG: hypothetical protein F6J94_29480 [Moorea sp. SIO1F2]|uniref:hypothetical protein n=1 Tax=unclassified Moorena TaxID=2683338 RepID=UPI0013BDD6EC|nr:MULTISPECIES: hypothetical protein [unclassified Moorena]NEN99302.1 hypothetical protein [Moorena sp. SIO3I7]NEO06461.1 hypothetical protein [Moorena sp. SIO3I8]NEO22713.1 hypothetical protein [Moorena sp. SIO4A5]NEP23265.1 hypothetical protein [Moorena sp. SIO3I6]NEQ59508.1 hypothetical protein [Moorena sp. SIO4A1]
MDVCDCVFVVFELMYTNDSPEMGEGEKEKGLQATWISSCLTFNVIFCPRTINGRTLESGIEENIAIRFELSNTRKGAEEPQTGSGGTEVRISP